eukprot:GHVN01063172.1.p1 GENE.GHVN01063172.1~~GHVN01063172.1.p1  ORF type:complete len:180 (+),score=14.67 GHVN01063172.1:35-541(+)
MFFLPLLLLSSVFGLPAAGWNFRQPLLRPGCASRSSLDCRNWASSSATKIFLATDRKLSEALEQAAKGPVRQEIEAKLNKGLAPTLLKVDDYSNESGEAGLDFSTETHFRIEVESHAFRGLTPLARTRWVYELLGELLDSRVHAVQVYTKYPKLAPDLEIEGARMEKV